MARSLTKREQLQLFFLPSYVALSLGLATAAHFVQAPLFLTQLILALAIAIGSSLLLRDTFASLRRGDMSLDYIALLAIGTGVITGEFFVAAVIVLMLTGGETLERYGLVRAKRSLTALAHRLPHHVTVLENGQHHSVATEKIEVGTTILIRKGEVIPLDCELLFESATLDESSLTGEPYFTDKLEGDVIRSGTANAGEAFEARVLREQSKSSYHKILALIAQAQEEKSPLIRLADRYSGVFTLITLVLAGSAWYFTGDLHRALAVLVIATPCPLILATPIALMGGMNVAAKQRIIIKHLGALETLARVKAVIFDKTGTITLGKPQLTSIEVLKSTLSEQQILSIAQALERHSLHPLAKAVVAAAHQRKAPNILAKNIHETLGHGISGTIDHRTYTLHKTPSSAGLVLTLSDDSGDVARLHLEDTLKADGTRTLTRISKQGFHLSLFTGDTAARAKELAAQLPFSIAVQADCSPKDKLTGIAALQKKGWPVAMIGDGLNDAPALAKADVGLVYSHDEHTAATEAADVVFLGSELVLIEKTLAISQRTIRIATESIFVGIGLSVVGMVFASFGFIPPVAGALLQEAIDVAVILNALRASR